MAVSPVSEEHYILCTIAAISFPTLCMENNFPSQLCFEHVLRKKHIYSGDAILSLLTVNLHFKAVFLLKNSCSTKIPHTYSWADSSNRSSWSHFSLKEIRASMILMTSPVLKKKVCR